MKNIAIEFRLAQARDPKSQAAQGWAMIVVGKVEGIGHEIRSILLPEYPSNRQIAIFFSRSRKALHDWFNSDLYEAAKARVEKKPRLLVIPGRG